VPEPVHTDRYFTLWSIRYLDATNPNSHGQQRCVTQYMVVDLTNAQAKKGLAAGKICVLTDPRVKQLSNVNRVPTTPAREFCFNLDDDEIEAAAGPVARAR